jgi:hypothetical protein
MTGFRILCSGGCGRLVDPAVNRQCRKCRRKMALAIRRSTKKTQKKVKNG